MGRVRADAVEAGSVLKSSGIRPALFASQLVLV